MDIRFQANDKMDWRADCVLFFATADEKPEALAPTLWDKAPWVGISPALQDFTGKADECIPLYGHPENPLPRILAFGLGKKDKLTLQSFRLAVAKAVKWARVKNYPSLGICVENLGQIANILGKGREVLVKEAAVAALLSLYSCDTYRSAPDPEGGQDPRWLSFFFTEKEVPAQDHRAAREGEAEANGIIFARDLSNAPANYLNPTTLAEKAKILAKASGFSCEILDAKSIKKLGMGALFAVGQGSVNEPRFIIMEHCPKGQEKADPIILVGKGITFDTGGISLKPSLHMHEMKGDMGGAAAVLGFFKALASLPDNEHLPRVIGLIPSAENMPDGGAVRPGDVVTTMSGKTVEILNTDAEGRLILCDALTYAQKNWKPRAVINIATLTGACVIALGDLGAAIFTKDGGLRRQINDAADVSGDLFWPLPLWDEMDNLLKSNVADMANIGPREGGALCAALFLQRFIEKGTRWAHLDIAGPGYVVKTTPLHPVSGGTGVGVRVFAEIVRGFRD